MSSIWLYTGQLYSQKRYKSGRITYTPLFYFWWRIPQPGILQGLRTGSQCNVSADYDNVDITLNTVSVRQLRYSLGEKNMNIWTQLIQPKQNILYKPPSPDRFCVLIPQPTRSPVWQRLPAPNGWPRGLPNNRGIERGGAELYFIFDQNGSKLAPLIPCTVTAH